jgi:pyruvate/2-oxoglutarate dehydrogenase complex dihydrolipoamide acyltransferase (E2) component
MSDSTVTLDRAVVGEGDDAELTTWLQPNGAIVEADQPIAEVTSSKVVVEVQAPAAGRLRHLVDAGATLVAGQAIAIVEGA